MGKKLCLILTLCMMSVGMAFAQKTVSGNVYEAETGDPVMGATVRVPGTSLGAVTDIAGAFTIQNVPTDAKSVQVTYLGFEDADATIVPNMKIYMKSVDAELDEVVVMAFGTAKKSTFTGSAKVIGAEQIAETQKTNVVDALNGRVAGVQMYNASGQPGEGSPVVRFRGITSINAGNTPLYIVDGAPYDGDINNLNPSDIESITVQKDAASNALYGARGANGVIMITTKRAHIGDPAKITVDAKWGSNSRAIRRYKTINNPAHYYETYFGGLKNYYMNAEGLSEFEANQAANAALTSSDMGLSYNVYDVPFGQYLIGANGKLNPNATMGRIVNYDGQDFYLTADDWYDAAYKNSLRQEYNVQATQSIGNNTFFASFGYLNNEGITAHSNYERFTARVKADSQLKDWLRLGVSADFSHFEANSLDEDGVSNSSGNVFAFATQIAPIYPLYLRDANGKVMYDLYGNRRYDYGDGANAGLERPTFTESNALSDAILNTNNRVGNAFNGAATAEIRFLKDFKFTSVNTVNLDETRFSAVTNPFYGSYSDSNGILGKTHTRSYAYNFQQILNWHKQFGLNDIEVMAGHESLRVKSTYLYAGKSNMFDPNNDELAMAITDGSNTSYTGDYNNEGWFSRVMYNYDEKYFGSASIRRDASSRFHPDNRWGTFWTLSGAWIISKEDWFPQTDWIDVLKIKASYGSMGNDQIGAYRYTNTYAIDNANGHPAVVPNTMGNKDITWETIGNFNTGVEFELFKRRLTGSIEYFYRKTTDMLSWYPLPASFGYTGYYANVGDMRNSGIEIDLHGTIIKTKDLEWTADLNFTHYRNKITYLDPQRKNTVVDGVAGYESGNYYYGEGKPLYTFEMYKYAGVAKENMYYLDGDGNVNSLAEAGMALYSTDNGEALGYALCDAEGNPVLDADNNPVYSKVTTSPSEATMHLCGTALPDAFGGFGTSVRFKGFDFSINFSYQIGGKVLDTDYARMMASPTANGGRGSVMHADILNAWSVDNPNSNIPRYQYDDQYSASSSSRFLTNASYLSLQNINFGYTLPAYLTRQAGIERLRVYVAADNVALWSKRQGLDPRQSIAGSVTNSFYAPIRTISGGLTVTF